MAERLCIYCNNWGFDGGSPWFSDVTPGSDSTMQCNKNVWKRIGFFDIYSEKRFREIIETARTCDHYSPAGP
jgi:hypothetical protein